MNHLRKIINHQKAIGNEARVAEMSSVIIGREEVQSLLAHFASVSRLLHIFHKNIYG